MGYQHQCCSSIVIDGISRFSLLPRCPSQASLESLGATNNNGSTIVSGGSLRSTPSSTSLDKLSTTSIHSFHRFHFPSPQMKTDKVWHETSSSPAPCLFYCSFLVETVHQSFSLIIGIELLDLLEWKCQPWLRIKHKFTDNQCRRQHSKLYR